VAWAFLPARFNDDRNMSAGTNARATREDRLSDWGAFFAFAGFFPDSMA
jgi:hypothetical protein